METNTILIIVGILVLTGFISIRDVITEFVWMRDELKGNNTKSSGPITHANGYSKKNIDWEKVNALKPKYGKMSKKKLEKLDLTTEEEKIARRMMLKKKDKL